MSLLMTEASLAGQGAVMSGRSTQGLWECPHLTWHINCLEMLAVFQASKQFLPDLRGHHILVRSDNTLVVSYILRSRHTELMEQIWKKFGRAQVDFRKPWLLYRRRSHPPPPLNGASRSLKHSFFSWCFLLFTFYIANVFIYKKNIIYQLGNNIYLQHMLSCKKNVIKNVRRYIFSGLLKFALLEKNKKVTVTAFFFFSCDLVEWILHLTQYDSWQLRSDSNSPFICEN